MWRYILWGIVCGIIIGSASQLRAHATTLNEPVNVCAALHDHVSLTNIETALEAGGLTPTAAGNYAGLVVRTQCPDMIGYVMGQVV